MATSIFKFNPSKGNIAGGLLIGISLILSSCKSTPLESVIGTHRGTCHYVDKNISTGEIYKDSTYESSIEIIRQSEEYVYAVGCGAPLYSFSMPEGSAETEFYSSQTAANAHGYTFEIRINLEERTIKTQSVNYGNPIGPYRKIMEGTFTF